jgi:hypothetical protein
MPFLQALTSNDIADAVILSKGQSGGKVVRVLSAPEDAFLL